MSKKPKYTAKEPGVLSKQMAVIENALRLINSVAVRGLEPFTEARRCAERAKRR